MARIRARLPDALSWASWRFDRDAHRVVLELIAVYYGGQADSAILFVTDLTWRCRGRAAQAIEHVIGSNR